MPSGLVETNRNYIAFLNYDHQVENRLPEKINNPLHFDNQLFIEAEIITACKTFQEPKNYPSTNVKIRETVSKKDYIEKVNILKKHIQQGDIYEINYCITFEAYEVKIDPLTVYQKLNALALAPYSTLFKTNNQYIISSSPELFLTKTANTLFTKPIKGTAKRGFTEEEDDLLKNSLRESEKELNENVMIVDVARNDLSKVATKGSVKVEKLFDIESYNQVHQMVSTVKCDLKKEITFSNIISSTFPMASMTGAPKLKAMELINKYELYNRGPFSGALGYILQNGDFDLNVIIRSIFYDEENNYLSFSVGSAITAMCNAKDEYDECMLKAYAMLKVLES